MRPTIKLDRAGIRQILTSAEVAAAVHDVAQEIASHAQATQPSADIVVDDYVTDRAASSVTVRDVKALLWQVKHGHLTRAAAAAGVTIRSTKSRPS